MKTSQKLPGVGRFNKATVVQTEERLQQNSDPKQTSQEERPVTARMLSTHFKHPQTPNLFLKLEREIQHTRATTSEQKLRTRLKLLRNNQGSSSSTWARIHKALLLLPNL